MPDSAPQPPTPAAPQEQAQSLAYAQPAAKSRSILGVLSVALAVVGASALHVGLTLMNRPSSQSTMQFVCLFGLLPAGVLFCGIGMLLAAVGMMRQRIGMGMVIVGFALNVAAIASFVYRWVYVQP